MATETVAAVSKPRKIRLGDLLIEHKIISREQLETALASQRQSGRKLGRVLIENGFLTEEQLLGFLSRQLQIPYVDLKRYHFKPDVVRQIPETHARRYRVILLEDGPAGPLMGMADPTDLFGYDEIIRLLHRPARISVVRESDLLKAIDLVYRHTDEISGLAAELEQEIATYDVDLTELAAEGVTDAPVVKLLQTVFEDAVQVNASDIHIEPDERALRIRFRLDGELRVQTNADRKIAAALVSRLKLMAGLDIAEKRLPQDGRCNVRVREQQVDVRISTLPVQHGESVVMRLLNQSTGLLDLESLGMPPDALARFREVIAAPHGMVLVTGPTGSGKTTTLYGALKSLNNEAVKIVTVEDPVEYRLHGINQVQVNPKIEFNFARALRSILRQDPDIILVGEMRDQETVEIGLRAAMTGHLVLSTLHTNDAISTALRLMDMGAPGYLLAASLRAIVSQRLVRRICESCAVADEPEDGLRTLIEREFSGTGQTLRLRRGRGCPFCNDTGYQGRIGVFEFLEMNHALAQVLHQGDGQKFAEVARSQPGYRSLRRGVLLLAAQGLTTLDQAGRVAFGIED
ncbi:MAG TPA: GspE/PulE family protein [Acidiferrobacteraceae bacterium]|nr:GspE/PulE family protein [Acidiferrobacteraceae bacterium]